MPPKKASSRQDLTSNSDGIVNPSGAAIGGFAAAYLVGVPITSSITKVDGLLQSLIQGTLKLIPGGVAPGRTIPALTALYLFITFGATGALSAAGQAMARREGLDNNSPRKHIHSLDGLPLRLRSAHYGLLENFAGFAIAASLAQSLAPTDAQITNLLGLHVLLKVGVYYASYVADIAPPRTLSHVLATSAVLNVCWRLANGA
ncbi:hypothetical protein N0V93_002029 [Gnomoniopsis smithogilvyi]|uniref:MAPEG family protein n=1 Tax=Gnomoniopsis smithogilvyi TaxID=1191159 RepID=A0A9W8Z2S6_9PEZI|nr:hypothetical protein N0V93_002029 [Gnomoniopsis smithogilvyi]